jgi:thiosulfate dehydrogenase [quinone] large subunit
MDSERNEKGLLALAVFRILVGWLFIWAFFDKLLGLGFATPAGSGIVNGGSPSYFVTFVTDGIFKDFYLSLAGNTVVDIIFMAALLILGVTLILGITSKLATIGSAIFLVVMWSLHAPPSDNPIIDFRLILAVGLVAAYYLGGYERLSLYNKWKEWSLVKRFPILE